MPNTPYDVEVKGTVTLASPNPASKMNDLSVDFALPIPINHGSTDPPQRKRETACLNDRFRRFMTFVYVMHPRHLAAPRQPKRKRKRKRKS